MQSLMLIARSELRARWVSVLFIGLLAGLTGAVVVGAGTVARRTATADDRLAVATDADDVRSLIFGGTRETTLAIGREAIALPQVERGRVTLGGIARIDVPGLVYRSVMIGPPKWGDDLLSPVLSAGRLPQPDRADEIVVNEEATRGGPHAINLGDTVTLNLLTADEYPAFDANTPLVGLAGEQKVTVVGMVRVPGAPQDLPPLIGTQALADAHPQGIGGVGAALVQLRPGADTSTDVLTTGLLLLAAAGALAGAAAVAQARLVGAIPAAVLAAVLTAGIGLACGRIGPPGALRTVEPRPGWAPNIVLVAAVTLIVPVALLSLVGFRAKRTVGRAAPLGVRESRLVSRVGSLTGRPPSVFGLRFAVERPPGATGTSTGAAMVTVAGGVAGLLAALMFSASLDELVHTPVRYGHPTDIVIADAGPEVAALFARDERFDAVINGSSAELLIDGQGAAGVSQEALFGELQWELAAGRPPAANNEIVLGTRLAEELGKGVGDEVVLEDSMRVRHRLTVVGVGVVPNHGGGLGRSAALTGDALREVAVTAPFAEMGLGVKSGVSVDAVVSDLANQYEVEPATPPREVANLQQVDRVPLILGLFLTVLCLATLGHAITVTARQRRRDLAIARALGFVPRQSATSVVVMGLATTLSGLIVALPIGAIVGSLIWRRVAEGSALLGHVHYPWITLALVLPIGTAVALALVAIPARRAANDRILYNLRPE
ncbi:MAG TPA: FtsX-like permease family protein [Acidimicrobiales bacterium]|nr:FtsX-like permease family protein [Acidimicrobiales bacterium]